MNHPREKERSKERENTTTTTTASGALPVDSYKRLRKPSALLNENALAAGDVYRACRQIGGTDRDADEWMTYMESIEWTFTTGLPINRRNFRRSLRMWVRTRENIEAREAAKFARNPRENERRSREALEARKRLEKERFNRSFFKTEKAWALCFEQCGNCAGAGCMAGVGVPPAYSDRPYPPNECPQFMPRKGES